MSEENVIPETPETATEPIAESEKEQKQAARRKVRRRINREILNDLTTGPAVYILSAIVPILIMIAIFAMRGIYPFGTSCYLRSDMYHQYCPFYSELWEKLRNGDSLFYSWDIGMGTNFLAIFGYYLSSPTNWFISLFPQKSMIEIMNVIIILKLSASSFTCTYYLCEHHHRIHISAAIIGLFYALSAYIAAYSWNLMWLDCVLLLPLVILGLERLIDKGQGLLYMITLGLTILSNYYIAIMVCLSLVLYFIVHIVSMKVPEDKLDYVRATLRFIVYSLMAGGLAAVLLLPEVYALEYTASSNINFPDVWTRYFSFITMIKRELLNVDVSLGLDHMPNIYCGVAVLLLFPLYIMTKKIPVREKIMKVIALVVFFTAFNLNIPNFIWHGFHYPNSLPCRQSFIYIFLLLTICYDAVREIRETGLSKLTGAFWGVMLLLVYIGNTLTDEDDLTFNALYLSAIFIAVYALIMLLVRKRKVPSGILSLICYAVAIIEITVNMANTGYSTTGRTYYLRDYDAVENVVDYITGEDTSFYRMAKAWGYRTKNDSAWHNFRGPSTFSSTAYAGLTTLFGELGLEHSTNAYASNGATPVVYSMLGIKYLISNKIVEPDGIFTYIYGYDGEFIYENGYSLPIAYMVPSELEEEWGYDTLGNPFLVQNDFIEVTTGIDNVFTPLSFNDYTSTASITVEKDEHVYIYVNNKSIDTITITYGDDDSSEDFTGINHGRMIDLGYQEAGTYIYVSDKDASGVALNLSVYTMDVEKYQEAMTVLAEGGIDITESSSTRLVGTVTAKEDGLLFTSIPYDESWTVTVDGEKVEYEEIAGALIGLQLTAGTHEIRFTYVPRGFVYGLVISLVCLAMVIGLIVYKIIKKKELTEYDEENPVIERKEETL